MKCRQAAKLISQTMDGNLNFSQKFQLQVHLLRCAACKNLRKNLHHLRAASRIISPREPNSKKEVTNS